MSVDYTARAVARSRQCNKGSEKRKAEMISKGGREKTHISGEVYAGNDMFHEE